MEANNQKFNHVDSDARIRDILNSAEAFEEVDQIPQRSRLTFSNGFYANCTALFIDIRESSSLPSKHTRPVTGKIYRAYLSECVAVINSAPSCREVFINGDCVSGILNTPYTPDIDEAFSLAAKLNSATDILNWRLEKKGYAQIRCGIGLAYGRALMLKAGYSGSGINDVIWMGDVVNEASNLCHQGNKGGRSVIQVSQTVAQNLNASHKAFLTAVHGGLRISHYECNVVNTEMNDWLKEEKEKSARAAIPMSGLLGLAQQPYPQTLLGSTRGGLGGLLSIR
jgi:class 3 adenylate cyclase